MDHIIPPTTWQIFDLARLEYALGPATKEAERRLMQVRGERNVLAAEVTHRMLKYSIDRLYTTCVKSGLLQDAKGLLHGQKSPILEAYRKRKMIEGLNNR